MSQEKNFEKNSIPENLKDDKIDKYIEYKVAGGIHNYTDFRKYMFADCILRIKHAHCSNAVQKQFIDEYHGYLFDEYEHHILFRTINGYDISVSKIDLYTGDAILKKEDLI